MALQPKIFKSPLYRLMFDTYQQGVYSLRPRILVPIHSSDVSRKIIHGWGRHSVQLTCLMDNRKAQGTKAADTAALRRVPGDISGFALPKMFLTKKEIILAHSGMCCLFLPTSKKHKQDPFDFFLKGSDRCR